MGRPRGGLHSTLHVVCDGDGKPLALHLRAGLSDGRGADAILPARPDAEGLMADKGCDRKRLRKALAKRGMACCMPGRAHRKEPVVDDTALDTRRHRIERRVGRLKDWRRIATRDDGWAHTFDSAICMAATVIFW